MTSVTYPNGYVAQYDETIQIGDLVKTYNKGYHTITDIEHRPQRTPLFSYVKMYNDDGTRAKKLKSHCDGVYICRAETHINNEITTARQTISALEAILESLKPQP
jgi:hypothetical protein